RRQRRRWYPRCMGEEVRSRSQRSRRRDQGQKRRRLHEHREVPQRTRPDEARRLHEAGEQQERLSQDELTTESQRAQRKTQKKREKIPFKVFPMRAYIFPRAFLFCVLLCALCDSVVSSSLLAADPSRRFVYPGEGSKLVYDRDERGNRIPDFSHC